MKFQEPHLEPDTGDIDLNEILPAGIYDSVKNASTWLMTESFLNYLNFYLHQKRGKKLLEAVTPMGDICPTKG